MSAPAARGLVLAGEPSVQLLPPSVRDRSKVGEFRRLMILLMILAVVATGAGVTGAFLVNVAADAQLIAERARTEQILNEQLQYADAATIGGLVDATREAQTLVTTAEADWGGIYDEILDRLPPGTRVDAVTGDTPAPWEPTAFETLSPELLERLNPVVSIAVTVQSDDLLTAAEIALRMRSMDGYLFSAISGSVFDQTYLTTVVLVFDGDVLLNRYPADDAEVPDDDPVEGETPAPVGTPAPEETAIDEGVTS